MTRAKFCVQRKKRYKKVFKLASGFRGRGKNCYRVAKIATLKSLKYAYVGRKIKKREYKSKFIAVVNAAARENGLRYSEFIHGLRRLEAPLDKLDLRALYDIVQNNKLAFAEICSKIVSNSKKSLEA